MTEEPHYCLNCGSRLMGGYCHQCGQRAGRQALSFRGLLGEIADELFSWDSRLWRTLIPLLFRPGFLSAEFMAGRKARYVPPLRLYLIISFLLFLLLQQAGSSMIQVSIEEPPAASPATSEAEATVAGPGATVSAAPSPGSETGPIIDIADENSPAWLRRLEGRLQENALKMRSDPQAFLNEALEYLPHMMFLLLPLFALLLRVAYLFSPFHYLQHLIFSLHFHSFAYLLYLFGFALEQSPFHTDGLLVILLMIYLPLALRRAYGSSLTGAIGKSLAVEFVYALLLALGLAGVFVLTLSLV